MAANAAKRNKQARVKVTGDMIRYQPGLNVDKVGCFILGQPLTEENNYFEIKILSTGISGYIAVGLVPYEYDMESQPGWRLGSIAYHVDNGCLYTSSGTGAPFGPPSRAGDIIGCGLRKIEDDGENQYPEMLVALSFKSAQVYFKRNGVEMGQFTVMIPGHVNRLHPAIGMHSPGEVVEITVYPQKEDAARNLASAMDDLMVVDGAEDEWIKTYDVRIDGQIVEYTGNGVHIHDVGLAQGKHFLSTTCHYFEIKILDPGEHCYIAIGLVHKNYPAHRHPGWNMGSIAYHADDGKIFLGRGQGTPFGPKCYRGDVMGCGISFPCDYVTPSDGEDDEDEDLEDNDDVKQHLQDAQAPMQDANDLLVDLLDDLDDIDSEEEDDMVWPIWRKLDDMMPERARDGEDEMPLHPHVGLRRGNVVHWFDDPLQPHPDVPRKMAGMMSRRERPSIANIYGKKAKNLMVKVFFTRNGKRIGQKEVMMPKGGFYPAVGMLSVNEKVRVDLRPLTG